MKQRRVKDEFRVLMGATTYRMGKDGEEDKDFRCNQLGIGSRSFSFVHSVKSPKWRYHLSSWRYISTEPEVSLGFYGNM